eukprot:TRINITY_DN30584_c0_g1_i1.p1 TRINITY_DN30584_c0_g1~~TRINITY_DN30584_c0_g1_i1.p1  ORF type:complete len:256 (+),score=45.75 TRINITY_DN30584_c0_g1_i1:53-820(+)
MNAELMEAIRLKAKKRDERQAESNEAMERVDWDQNVQGLKRRFHKAYKYVMKSKGGGEGTEVNTDGEGVITLRQTDDAIGTTVYTAAVQAARFIETQTWKNKKCVELGSGTGIAGMVAAYMGAEVVLTDLAGPVFDNLKYNISLLPTDVQARITTLPLHWGETLPVLPFTPNFIIAIEVIYQQEFVAPLVATLQDLLRLNPALDILWAHDLRGRPGVPLFKDLTKDTITFSPIPGEELCPGYNCKNVLMYRGKSP